MTLDDLGPRICIVGPWNGGKSTLAVAIGRARGLPQRLARATGFILLDAATTVSLLRYLRRCWFERDRRGALEGARDGVKWGMIRHIVGPTRENRARYGRMFDGIALPKLRLAAAADLTAFYRREGLSR